MSLISAASIVLERVSEPTTSRAGNVNPWKVSIFAPAVPSTSEFAQGHPRWAPYLVAATSLPNNPDRYLTNTQKTYYRGLNNSQDCGPVFLLHLYSTIHVTDTSKRHQQFIIRPLYWLIATFQLSLGCSGSSTSTTRWSVS